MHWMILAFGFIGVHAPLKLLGLLKLMPVFGLLF